ncbi:MAG: hypothetical protein ABGZ24_20490 [Fuerstiella sp.]
MHKAIGFIACVSVMAASLYLFSGGDPSRVLSAQTESESPDSYGSVARRFMNDARQAAKQGDIRQARRLADPSRRGRSRSVRCHARGGVRGQGDGEFRHPHVRPPYRTGIGGMRRYLGGKGAFRRSGMRFTPEAGSAPARGSDFVDGDNRRG